MCIGHSRVLDTHIRSLDTYRSVLDTHKMVLDTHRTVPHNLSPDLCLITCSRQEQGASLGKTRDSLLAQLKNSKEVRLFFITLRPRVE